MFVISWTGPSPSTAADIERRIFAETGASCEFRDTPVRTGKDGPDGGRRGASATPPTMHSIEAGAAGPHVVCLPGYGAGAAFFYKNLEGLSKHAQVPRAPRASLHASGIGGPGGGSSVPVPSRLPSMEVLCP